MKIDIEQILTSKIRIFSSNKFKIIKLVLIKILNRLLHINEINNILETYHDSTGFELIDEVFEYLNFSYYLSSHDRKKIPFEGKLICVSNHPLGGLDGLALIKAISEVRPDVKVVVNDVLMNIENLRNVFLPFDIIKNQNQRQYLNNITQSLINEEAVIFFPAGEVSRLSISGIKDKDWMNGAVRIAQKYNIPVLPIYIKARNTYFFYIFSIIFKKISSFLLPREFFKKHSKEIVIKIGDVIPSEVFSSKFLDSKYQTKLLRKHVYRLGGNGKSIFKTEKTIIHPVNVKELKKELIITPPLSITPNGKKLFIVEQDTHPNVLKEIARQREISFRRVGEGTGHKLDLDNYDKYYKHLILWNDDKLDIEGSYRLGICHEILAKFGMDGLYNFGQFTFSDRLCEILEDTLELGRSFIQYQYWRSHSLDYLWQGIGAFLSLHPEIKYLFGAVSISNSYSDFAKSLIVQYYRKWYSPQQPLAEARNKFLVSRKNEEEISQILNGEDFKTDFNSMKKILKNSGFSVPVLLRQYSDLCLYGGVRFLDFGVDPKFSNSIDCLVLVDLSYLKDSKKERYYYENTEITKESIFTTMK